MKKYSPLIISLLLVFIMGFDSEPYWGQYKPVFMLRSELEKNVKLEEPKPVQDPGKIYIKDHLIFINEKYRGIHVIDNSNPENPTNLVFITIDGCIDIAVKDNILYADNAVDLIAVRFNQNLMNFEVTKRIKNVFPELVAPDGRNLTWQEHRAVPDGAVLVRWDKN
jgi:hypothetical protein